MIIGGTIILVIAIYLLIKKHEPRMVLFMSGLTMFIIFGEPLGAFFAFSNSMKQYQLFETIISVISFATVMKTTECDKNLVNMLSSRLGKSGLILIPATTLITFFVMIAMDSAAGTAAAVGSVLIPILISTGVHPATAGAAVVAGTYGGMLNPGNPLNAIVGKIANTSTLAIVNNHMATVLIAVVIVATSLTISAYLRKEHKGYVSESTKEMNTQSMQVDMMKAFMPLFPLVLLILTHSHFIPGVKPMEISHTMLIGTILAAIVTRQNPSEITKTVFKGMGEAFANVCGLIICALVFVSGMETLGMIKALTNFMITNPDVAKISASVGTLLLSVVTGSGNAAIIAFNQSVTIHAAQFGIDPMNMGSMTTLAGGLGRTLSPISTAAIVCAGFTGTNTIEFTKRNLPGIIIACIVSTVLLMYR